MIEPGCAAVCSFDGCSASIVERVVVAAVGQLCAHADISVELLDALEFPLGEALDAVADLGITRVDVDVTSGMLRVAIHLRTVPHDAAALLGDADSVVPSFFDVGPPEESTGLLLIGRLG